MGWFSRRGFCPGELPAHARYLGVLMHAAGVEPVAIQRAVAPQCCAGSARDGAQDVFLVLDGDEYFVRCRGC